MPKYFLPCENVGIEAEVLKGIADVSLVQTADESVLPDGVWDADAVILSHFPQMSAAALCVDFRDYRWWCAMESASTMWTSPRHAVGYSGLQRSRLWHRGSGRSHFGADAGPATQCLPRPPGCPKRRLAMANCGIVTPSCVASASASWGRAALALQRRYGRKRSAAVQFFDPYVPSGYEGTPGWIAAEALNRC